MQINFFPPKSITFVLLNQTNFTLNDQKQTNNLFLELLKLSLSEATTLSRVYSKDEWLSAFAMAQSQSLTGVLLDGINKLDSDQKPFYELKMSWILTVERIKKSNTYLNSKVLELSEMLAQKNMRLCILKGQGIATYYPDPMVRCPGDIDAWVDADRESIIKLVREKFPHEDISYLHVEYPIFNDVDVELHFTPSYMCSYWHNRKLQRFFKEMKSQQFINLVQLPFTDKKVSIATREFNMLFILSHIYKHLFTEGIGMRQLVDYYYVLRQCEDEGERERTVKRIKLLEMMRFTRGVMYIMKEIFGLEDNYLLTEPNEKDGIFLLNEIMRSGNFGVLNPVINYRNKIKKFCFALKRNTRFITYYPSESIWNLIFRTWQYLWRWKNGYFKRP